MKNNFLEVLKEINADESIPNDMSAQLKVAQLKASFFDFCKELDDLEHEPATEVRSLRNRRMVKNVFENFMEEEYNANDNWLYVYEKSLRDVTWVFPAQFYGEITSITFQAAGRLLNCLRQKFPDIYEESHQAYATACQFFENKQRHLFAYRAEMEISLREKNKSLTRYERIQLGLQKNGFFDLPKVSRLNKSNRNALLQVMAENEAPYIVAMLKYLGYWDQVINRGATQNRICKDIQSWINPDGDKTGSNIRHLYESLSFNSKQREENSRFRAWAHLDDCEKKYNSLLK